MGAGNLQPALAAGYVVTALGALQLLSLIFVPVVDAWCNKGVQGSGVVKIAVNATLMEWTEAALYLSVFMLAGFGAPFLLCIRDSADGSASMDGEELATARTLAAVVLALCACSSFCAAGRLAAGHLARGGLV